MKAVVALLVLSVVVLGGCASQPPAPAPASAPGVVSSVEVTVPGSGTALTVTQGAASYRIFNVRFDQPGAGSECEVRSDTDVARRMLVGRTVATTEYFQRWDDPAVPAGYTPAELTFVTPDRPRGDDLRTGADGFGSAAAAARAVACPNLEQAPLSGREVSDSDGDVYVDGDGGGRNWCRKWWC